MWADLCKLYGLALNNATKYGNHDDLRNYCKNNGDVLYLRTFLNDKPCLIEHVKSGFYR